MIFYISCFPYVSYYKRISHLNSWVLQKHRYIRLKKYNCNLVLCHQYQASLQLRILWKNALLIMKKKTQLKTTRLNWNPTNWSENFARFCQFQAIVIRNLTNLFPSCLADPKAQVSTIVEVGFWLTLLVDFRIVN